MRIEKEIKVPKTIIEYTCDCCKKPATQLQTAEFYGIGVSTIFKTPRGNWQQDIKYCTDEGQMYSNYASTLHKIQKPEIQPLHFCEKCVNELVPKIIDFIKKELKQE